MPWRGLRIPIILLVLVASLVVFWGAHWLFNRFSVEQPLADFLKSQSYIHAFEINRDGSLVQISVLLAPVENLKDTYGELDRGVRNILGVKLYELVLRDKRDVQLKDAFYYSQFAAYEAVMRGNYREMFDYVNKQAAERGATASVFIDQDRIYLQMRHDNNYLYEVIPRPSNKTNQAAMQ
ncbi:MAG TPA: hypothetical protein DCK76_01595 [Desulfotomaculum sp.]|nr:MAG: hypothetical protein XD84_2013 [Desulfotomaculum sp. 46_80]HAG10099.1 hypothetical protein [Desulfotomaculum sp.]HBY04034.1 hypothetical protein [Desulfotomaculum sp.]